MLNSICWIFNSIGMCSFLVSALVTNAALRKSLLKRYAWNTEEWDSLMIFSPMTQFLFCFCCLTEGLWCRWCCRTVISCCCGYWFWHNIQWLRLQLHQGARMYSCNEVRAAMQHLVFTCDNMVLPAVARDVFTGACSASICLVFATV